MFQDNHYYSNTWVVINYGLLCLLKKADLGMLKLKMIENNMTQALKRFIMYMYFNIGTTFTSSM
jgi:hypothetical protein